MSKEIIIAIFIVIILNIGSFYTGKDYGELLANDKITQLQEDYNLTIDGLNTQLSVERDKYLAELNKPRPTEHIIVKHNCDNKVMSDTLNRFVNESNNFIVEK